MSKIFTAIALLLIGLIAGYLLGGDSDVRRVVDERSAEVQGALASRYVASQTEVDERAEVKTVAGLNLIEVAVHPAGENIYRASGVANTFLIHTPAGNVLFDTGLGTQAARHKRLLQQAVDGPVTHIILSHSHADHIGGTKFWLAEFPDAEVITHEKFRSGQRYLTDLEDHFWNRNRLLYTFMPEEPPESGMVAYGGVEPTREIGDDETYAFELGGTRFEVLGTPGAEGEDNIVLWLPEQKALFSGDFFGPLFPMMPNLFTLRGEKFRDPLAYVRSLDRLIELAPETILPSHFEPLDHPELVADLRKMRDGTLYVHDQTIAGMNAGIPLWQLMREIKLPPELALSEGHGKVSWNVRSIWEHYSTWFHFESTTELYPTQVRELYPALAELTGGSAPLLQQAWQKLDEEDPEAALHFVEIALAGAPDDKEALRTQLTALEQLLARAFAGGSNYSETGWLKSRISATQEAIAQ